MPTEAEMRLHRCCFTGHRPEKLRKSERDIRSELEKQIKQAVADGFTTFITGMARGTDIIAGEIVLQLRTEKFPVRLICASPYPGFEEGWSNAWQKRYRNIIETADLVRYISASYSRSCFQNRNEWMVNHSSRVIAVFNGQPSGTKNTIDYAHRQGVPVIQIEG